MSVNPPVARTGSFSLSLGCQVCRSVCGYVASASLSVDQLADGLTARRWQAEGHGNSVSCTDIIGTQDNIEGHSGYSQYSRLLPLEV